VDLITARTEFKARGFDYLSDARANTMLNNAKNAFEDEWPWPWLETTTSGVAPFTISDLKYVLDVQTAAGVELQGIDPKDADLTAGAADSWWLDGTQTLRTSPVDASTSLAVRYVRFSPDLAASSDTPLIPSRYHPVWIDYAVVEAYKDDDNYQAAQALLAFIRATRLPQLIETYVWRNRATTAYQEITFAAEDW
jgi:hypothetical protein